MARRSIVGWTRLSAVVVLQLTLLVWACPALAEAPANQYFQRTWMRTDQPVATGQATRTWMWGPEAFTTGIQEEYAEAAGNTRTVQYFDKSRMEISHLPSADPNSIWYITNGLLVTELITGEMQVGDASFVTRSPATVNVSGDPDDTIGPTYASFKPQLTRGYAERQDPIYRVIHRDGTDDFDERYQAYDVAMVEFAIETGHWIAEPFWRFMNSTGPVYENGQYVTAPLFQNPYYATGFPITDAYWANVKVNGSFRDVLIQCFQRRCLTYTPSNDPTWQVEMGNVGQHYYTWRYSTTPPPPSPPTDDIPIEGDVLYQSSLGDWPADTNSQGATGAPSDDGSFYIVAGPPSSAFYMFNESIFGDASYSVDILSTISSGDTVGCLAFRATEQGVYHLCLAYAEGSAIGHLAFYLSLEGEGSLIDLGTYAFPAPESPEQWRTVKIIASGNRFWFYGDGVLLGDATHDGPTSGLTGLGMICIDETDVCGAAYRNLVVRAISGGDTPLPPPPPDPGSPTTFGDGTYVIGNDIPPGTYRNSDSSGGCYWERLSGFGGTLEEIIANDFTDARTIVTIAPSDTGFSSDRCGTWTSDLSAITSSPTADFSDGTYIVGVDVAPGRWQNTDSSEGCYWARLSGFGGELDDIIDNEFTYDSQIVTISASDEGFTTSGCGTWVRIGG
jgi:hypothetical protein